MLQNFFKHSKNIFSKIFYMNTLYFKYYFKFKLKFVWFFTDTIIGYCIYIFCMAYGVTGLSSNHNLVIKAQCSIFAITVVGLVIQTYILVKIPFTKQFLENWIGKQYIIDHLGEYSGSRAIFKLISTTVPIAGFLGTELATKSYDSSLNQETADAHIQRNVDSYKKGGIPMDQKALKQILTEAHKIANKAPI